MFNCVKLKDIFSGFKKKSFRLFRREIERKLKIKKGKFSALASGMIFL